MPRLAAHRVTTAHLQAAYPFVAGTGLGTRGVYVGEEIFGGAFCFDPWTLYATQRLTNPNMLIAGQLGRGKSALVKCLLLRSAVFGRRAAVLDPKGEYQALAAALGADVIRLRPGGDIRINPLDPGSAPDLLGGEEVRRRQVTLLQAVAAAALKRDLAPIERAACRAAIDRLTAANSTLTLPTVAECVGDPHQWAPLAGVPERAAEPATRDLSLELARLCQGELRGMFDGESNIDVDWNGPLVVLDVSQLPDDDGLSIVMACATAWIQAAIARPGAGHRYLVVDEAWRLLSHLGTARWLRSSLKLARQFGISNVLVFHRLSDLLAAGDSGSEQVRIAQGLLSDTETRVVFAQPHSEGASAGELLGLSDADRRRLPDQARGLALWKVGQSTHLVHHAVGESEAAVVDTDRHMEAVPLADNPAAARPGIQISADPASSPGGSRATYSSTCDRRGERQGGSPATSMRFSEVSDSGSTCGLDRTGIPSSRPSSNGA